MFDTSVTVSGNVLTAPEWRRTSATGTYVVTFRFGSTSRRFDKVVNRWVDGDSLRVKVACWRRLGENVFESVRLGDPLVIHGRLYSRDWTDSEGRKRTSYELDAAAVGHDLARGVSKFARRKAIGATDSMDDDENTAAVGGESSQAMRAPGRPADLPPEHELFDEFDPDRFDSSVPRMSGGEGPDSEDDDDDIDEEVGTELSVAV